MAKDRRRTTVKVSQIRELSRIQCSESDAAGVLGLSLKTFKEMLRIDDRAREAWEFGRSEGRRIIRAAQFRLADRHPQMAIFLGKQYLGQSEVSVIEHTGRDGGPIKTLDLTKLDAKGRAQLRDIITTTRVKKDA